MAAHEREREHACEPVSARSTCQSTRRSAAEQDDDDADAGFERALDQEYVEVHRDLAERHEDAGEQAECAFGEDRQRHDSHRPDEGRVPVDTGDPSGEEKQDEAGEPRGSSLQPDCVGEDSGESALAVALPGNEPSDGSRDAQVGGKDGQPSDRESEREKPVRSRSQPPNEKQSERRSKRGRGHLGRERVRRVLSDAVGALAQAGWTAWVGGDGG